MKYDLIVIGGGPAGYAAAIRAGQLGKKAACVEMDRAGGTCLNWGCIPTKSLIRNAEVYQLVREHADDFGLQVDGVEYSWDKVIGRSRKVSEKLAGGIEFLFKKNKIDHIEGNAKVTRGRRGSSPCEVEVYGAKVKETLTHAPVEIEKKAKQTITADHVIIATGSVARDLPFARFDGEKIIGARFKTDIVANKIVSMACKLLDEHAGFHRRGAAVLDHALAEMQGPPRIEHVVEQKNRLAFDVHGKVF